MDIKLPVKTIRLSRKKRVGMPVAIAVSLLSGAVFHYIGVLFMPRYGYLFFHLIAILFNLNAFFEILGLIRFAREKFIGMFISRDGINDLSTGNKYGMVLWRDVYKIKIMQDLEYPKYQYIILKVTNPEEYIARESVASKKRSMTLKFHYYGSPICFSNRGLDCSFEELESSVRQYYADFLVRQQEWKKSDKLKKIDLQDKV